MRDRTNQARARVLFLDDDPRRIEMFRQLIDGAGCDVTIVETADECIARLAESVFDLVLLDHDLGGEIYCDSSREDCGMEVVRWLGSNRGAHGGFIIHTHNEVAAASMYIALEQLGYPVAQGMFGSGEFYRALSRHIDLRRSRQERERTLREKLRDYLRSLRLGR